MPRIVVPHGTLPIEPKDPSKPCFVKMYYAWVTQSGMFRRIIKDANKNNWKIVDHRPGLLQDAVTFQER